MRQNRSTMMRSPPAVSSSEDRGICSNALTTLADIVDVVTSGQTHFDLSWAALEGGKHVLCEKPVHRDYRQTRAAADLASSKGLKTKLGFTFRYSPGVRYAKSMIDEGFVGTPFIYNGYEQNSQWLDPNAPRRMGAPEGDQSVIQTSSLEGYGAPVIDIGHWWVDSDYTRVVGTMRNFVPERMAGDTGMMTRMNLDDGDIYACSDDPLCTKLALVYKVLLCGDLVSNSMA